MKHLTLLIFATLFCQYAWSFGSLCGTYDVENTHPDEVRTNMILRCMHVGSDLYLDGSIDVELIFELTQFSPEPVRRIFLNSTGGKVDDAIEVAEYIRANNITTVLRPGAKCMSACTLLFQAGTERIAHPSAQLMYHSARNPFLQRESRDLLIACETSLTPECEELISERTAALQASTDELFHRYVLYGASPLLYEDYKIKDHDPNWISQGNFLRIENWYMTPEEAWQYDIPTRISCETSNAWNYTFDSCNSSNFTEFS